jgi:RES domain-containing protein
VRTLWRISDYADLAGLGGEKFSSRWTTFGKRIVYLAESPSGALLEILVHLQFEDQELPDEYQLLEVAAPDEMEVSALMPQFKESWRQDIAFTQRIGDQWLASRNSALARVPSAVMPRTWNVLLNPLHPDAAQLRIESVIRERFDTRLFHFGAR